MQTGLLSVFKQAGIRILPALLVALLTGQPASAQQPGSQQTGLQQTGQMSSSVVLVLKLEMLCL